MKASQEVQNLETEAEEVLSENTTSEQAFSFVVKALSLVIVGESVKDAMFRTICRFGAQWEDGALERAVDGLNKSTEAYVKNLYTARVLASPRVVWSKVAKPDCWKSVYRAIGQIAKSDPTMLGSVVSVVDEAALADIGYLTVSQAGKVLRSLTETESTYDEAFEANEAAVKAVARKVKNIVAEYEALNTDPSDEARKLLVGVRSTINNILGDSDK